MMYLLPACSGRRMVAGDAGPPNPQCNDHHRDHWIIREIFNIWLVIFGETKSSNWLEAKILDSDWSMLDLPICNAMIIIAIIGSSERSSIFGIIGSSERFSIFVLRFRQLLRCPAHHNSPQMSKRSRLRRESF